MDEPTTVDPRPGDAVDRRGEPRQIRPERDPRVADEQSLLDEDRNADDSLLDADDTDRDALVDDDTDDRDQPVDADDTHRDSLLDTDDTDRDALVDDDRTDRESLLDDDRTDDETPLLHEGDDDSPLLDHGGDWVGRWNEIQAGFVDEPRRSIENADALVDEVIEKLTSRFADERARLESQWTAGSEPSTEELRVALQRYRSFFNRLLAA